MNLLCESDRVEHYLSETEEVNYRHDAIIREASRLYDESADEIDFVRRCYEFVRDGISHSMDIGSSRVTCSASDVLLHKEGICYAKSNLLAAMLRSRGVPAGFCYQRLTLGDTPETGYCIHALNAVLLRSSNKWIRLDARGNKEGIRAEFSTEEEKLAFPVRREYGELDYPVIYAAPNGRTIQVLKANSDCRIMCMSRLPEEL